jgi:hypothetical protein
VLLRRHREPDLLRELRHPGGDLGFGRIVASEIKVPIMLVNMV